MLRTQSLDDLVKKEALQFADQIRKAAEFATTEEEIRIEAERALAVIQKESGLTLSGRHEYTIGTGRADSVYGCVIIEYKNPHSTADRLSPDVDSPNNQKVIRQIQKRFTDFNAQQNVPLNTMFGVGCDGNYFIFVRYRDIRWQVEDPVLVSRYSSERFLWALINMGTKGKAFSPEYLAGDFGSNSRLSHEGVKALYSTICSTRSPKAGVFFQQWKILFGEVCGYDVITPTEKIRQLASFYEIEGNISPSELLFSIHTYYSIFMKLLASEIVAFFHKLPTPLQRILQAPTSTRLKEEMEDLERGSIFQHLNITNFLEGDLFAWYPGAWNESIDKLIRDIANKLDGYNPGTLSEDPAGSRDLLKKLYQELFPRGVRHDLGEYYTPDWLAEHVLHELDYYGDPDKRLLDPACGSGTFLVMAINRIREWYENNRDTCGYDEGGLARRILRNVVGFDLNPLAVMAARTNYLITMKDLIGRVDRVEIPIYLCDSIMTLSEYGGLDTYATGNHLKTKELKTSVANFKVPLEIAGNRDSIAKYAGLLEFCISSRFSAQEFIEKCKNEGFAIEAEDLHKGLYTQLIKLDSENKNGVWARIIKNAFAPLFCERFDFVAGNPPWINWKSLPADYRNSMKPLWVSYSLFSLSGTDAQYGGSEKDIALLFICVALDKYLELNGKLGYVITQTIFQTKGAADGFRACSFKNDKNEIRKFRISKVHDAVDVMPFEGVANRTATIVIENSKDMLYPVPYFVWKKKKGRRITEDIAYDDLKDYLETEQKIALPLDKPSSPWLITDKQPLFDQKKISGKSAYKAIAGSCTWLDAVYSISVLKEISDSLLMIQNNLQAGKIRVPRVEATIEKDMIYLSIRGRDIKKWNCSASDYIIIPQDPEKRRGYDESYMKRKAPRTYKYLLEFKDQLLDRSGYKKYFQKGGQPFYSIYNVSEETFKPFKVAWRYISTEFECCVIGSFRDPLLKGKPVIPDNKVMFVPLDNEDEAHYLCGVLNSKIVKKYVEGFTIDTQISTYVLEHVRIPLFTSKNKVHRAIAELSKKCHALAKREEYQAIEAVEVKIDDLVPDVFGGSSV